MAKACVIVNPSAGATEQVLGVLRGAADEYDCELVELSPGQESADVVATAQQRGVTRLVVTGGDGTISRVADAILAAEARIELGVVPLGTGNDLARSLGLAGLETQDAMHVALRGQARAMDVVRFDGDVSGYMLNCASGGAGGEIGQETDAEDKKRWGSFAYWIAAVSKLADLPQYDLTVTYDGQQRTLAAHAVEVCNGRFVGGGFPIAPQAMLDDGLIDVTLLRVQPAFEAIAAGLNMMRGRGSDDKRLVHLRARRVEVRAEPKMPMTIDGEYRDRVDATFEVMPRALAVVPSPEAEAISTGASS